MDKQTLWQQWIDGKVGNFGGFQTKLFHAYTEADNGNRTKLKAAFPHWFEEEVTKRFLFITDASLPGGYGVLLADTLEQAEQAMKEKGYYPIVWQNGWEIVEKYHLHWIIKRDTTISVFDPYNNILFVVGLDDSKRCGHRTFDESANNVETAKAYIDHLTRKK